MVRGWKPPKQRRCGWTLWVVCLLGAVVLIVWPRTVQEDETIQTCAAPVEKTDMLPEGVIPGLPDGERERLTITAQRLLQGKMLLVDEAHPLPENMAAPNTLNVSGFSHGRIACRDPLAQLDEAALTELQEMCVDARNRGIGGLTVMAGTRSQEQQRILLNEKVEQYTRTMTIEEAVVQAKRLVPPPGCSEHQLPWTVDIRICRAWNKLPETEPLSASEEGCWLTEHAWEYGFLQRWPEADPDDDDHRPYCFRYVGKVHASMMHTLGASLEEYLALLQTYGALTLMDENGAPVLSAAYAEAGERHTVFELPKDIILDDASIDNQGGAVLAFSYR